MLQRQIITVGKNVCLLSNQNYHSVCTATSPLLFKLAYLPFFITLGVTSIHRHFQVVSKEVVSKEIQLLLCLLFNIIFLHQAKVVDIRRNRARMITRIMLLRFFLTHGRK